MASSYIRKSSFTRTNILASLGIDPIFAALTSAQKNQLIDEAVQRVASLRNSLGKEDYKFDSSDIADIIAISFYTKHIYLVVVEKDHTYDGTTYNVDTVLVKSTYGLTVPLVTPVITLGVLNVLTTSEFTTAVQVVTNQWNILYATSNPDNIYFNIGTSGWGVYSILIYEV